MRPPLTLDPDIGPHHGLVWSVTKRGDSWHGANIPFACLLPAWSLFLRTGGWAKLPANIAAVLCSYDSMLREAQTRHHDGISKTTRRFASTNDWKLGYGAQLTLVTLFDLDRLPTC